MPAEFAARLAGEPMRNDAGTRIVIARKPRTEAAS
jgi:hypothetical protein